MLSLLRRLKFDTFMDSKFRRYLAYGLGELLLVVIGILIALQIDNWNDDRKERATLQSYLESIARNMQEDLSELERLRAWRHDAQWAAGRLNYLFNRDRFERDEIFFLSRTLMLGTNEHYFSANTSGFDALKVSGVLNRLQGSRLEQLMSTYYDMVSQVERLEENLYDDVRPILMELTRDQPRELVEYAVINPAALPDERFEDLQAAYSEHVNHPLMRGFGSAQFRNTALMRNYDSLVVLGEAFIGVVKSGRFDEDFPLPRTPVEAYNAGLAMPGLVLNGRPELSATWLGTADSFSMQSQGVGPTFRFDSIEQRGNELHFEFLGGSDWAVAYWSAISVAEERSFLDYSPFKTLVLEMKGDRGGETVKVHVKDADYPDDIAPVSVDLVLSDDWQIYEIDLEQFAPNDLSRLHVVLGFLIFPAQDPLAFSVRNAWYR